MSTFKSSWLSDSKSESTDMSVVTSVSNVSSLPIDNSKNFALEDAFTVRDQTKMPLEDFEAVLKVFIILRQWQNELNATTVKIDPTTQ